MNPNCIGAYFTDGFWEMPPLSELTAEELISYCKQNSVCCIIPTRDGELEFFADLKETLRAAGISVMVSDTEAVKICLDKWLFSTRGTELGFPVIPAALSLDGLSQYEFYVVKDRFGAGSRKMGLRLTREEALRHASELDAPLFQPYVKGQEYSVDLYIDKKGAVKGVIVRTRDLVIGGESQITTAVNHPGIETVCSDFASKLQLYGHIVFQLIEDSEGAIHIVECNCRFGGASTLSLEMGLDSFYWFFLEANGHSLDSYPFIRSDRNKKQVRYSADLII
jgi:carbamoyl-phosphate synthase large subunit